MQSDEQDAYELDDEYDFSKMEAMPRGRFAPERTLGTNVALLDPEVARAFPSDQAVNEALRLVLQLSRVARGSHSD
jgi:hypothetical protein